MILSEKSDMIDTYINDLMDKFNAKTLKNNLK